MRRTIARGAALLTLAAMLLFGGAQTFAAETRETSAETKSDTLDALHGGAPPSVPGAAAVTPAAPQAAPGSAETLPPPTFASEGPPPKPDAESEPVRKIAALYPSDVRGIEENGSRWIVKTYELGAEESPEGIARESFELDGWRYDLTDILKNETAAAETREHTETVTLNTDTKELDKILPLLAPTLDFTTDDGFAGVLTLDVSSVKAETAGTKTTGFTKNITREYPRLSESDTSLIPKTIDDGGRTYTLTNVDWRAGNLESIDYADVPGHFTAVAVYSRTGTSTTVTGYVVAAEYKGTVAKIVSGKTVCTAYFMGTPSAPEDGADEPAVPLSAAGGAAAGAGLLGGAVFFFFLRKNVKVHNLKGGKCAFIGKTRVTAGNPVIDLTPFADKAATGSFVLVLDFLAAKSLSGKTVTVNFGAGELRHIVTGDGGGEYRFEVDF